MNVTIIGGAGRMGRWLTHYFVNQGHNVRISDTRFNEAADLAKSSRAEFVKENTKAVQEADLTIVSTPIPTIPQVLREIFNYLKKDSIIAEIASLKTKIAPIMIEATLWNVKPLSIHPLFGPGAQKLKEGKVVLIPLINPSSEIDLVKEIFPGIEVIVVDAEEHDRAMALTLSIPHFMNIAFASTISEEDLNVLKKLGGTTFTLQLTLSESVMNEDPRLYASIQMDNDYTSQYLEKFLSRCRLVRDLIVKKDVEEFAHFYSSIRVLLSKDEDFNESYERMYRALERL